MGRDIREIGLTEPPPERNSSGFGEHQKKEHGTSVQQIEDRPNDDKDQINQPPAGKALRPVLLQFHATKFHATCSPN
ncbi:predicted protein [Bradyrhizobium oligotrophicum S58]|uniref:Uncharacterized protein n=1 Tax=Bradyrhizobium oligotrophicum S58 TaxID=1245469 RepID=M4Z512_9BRAD|nr:predicted protein [Bradyrhizobium oligotrophicum S58]